MDVLRAFYLRSMTALAAIALGAAVLLQPLGIASLICIALLLCGAEQLLRKKIWRLVHAELDFSGTWVGFASYPSGQSASVEKADQTAILEQTCLSLKMLSSEGTGFQLHSRAIDILDGGKSLLYAYQINYSGNRNDRPLEAYGIEKLDVVSFSKGSRPTRLKGWFAHCDRGQKPILSGEASLERKDS